MWQSLRLDSLGVIAQAELDFSPGLTVITGETGAGKTMVVTALGLLRGERANLSTIRAGQTSARIEASILGVFDEVRDLVTDAGGEADDELWLARVLSANGRSRAVAGGASVPAGLLAKVTDRLVAVHGQADQQRLVQADQQRRALDRFAGDKLAKLLQDYESQWEGYQAARSKLEAWTTQSAERTQRFDLLTFGLNEINAIQPKVNEDQELAREEDRLAHAEGLARGALLAAHLMTDADVSIHTLLNEVATALDGVSGHDSHLDELARRVNTLRIEADDIASEMHAYGTDIDVDPQRLSVVQARRSELIGLQRKYGKTLDDVLEWARHADAEVQELDMGEEALDALRTEVVERERTVTESAQKLTDLRVTAAKRLSAAIENELKGLALERATMNIDVANVPLTRHGQDRVTFLFAANSGSEPQPVGQAASGGELSRLMLAIEVVLADRNPVPTLVFDEVDAGIGGRTAVEVGRKLAKLAKHTQIIVVTHLPQVAAFADQHYVVTKNDDGDVTQSSVYAVSDADRVGELARMLSGLENSETALAHARELLSTAQTG